MCMCRSVYKYTHMFYTYSSIVHMYACMQMFMHVRACVCMFVCMGACMYVRMCMFMCMCMWRNVCIEVSEYADTNVKQCISICI